MNAIQFGVFKFAKARVSVSPVFSITHISLGEEVAEVDVVVAGGAAPEDFAAGRRTTGAGKIAAELGEFEEVVAEAGWGVRVDAWSASGDARATGARAMG
ncbi:MAG: hypothetical protein ACO1QS_15015 [Verrucomicrobiota bacterium]